MSDKQEQNRPLNEFDLSDMFDEINKKHFQNRINKIPVEWNNRLRTTAGKAFYKRIMFTRGNLVPTKIEMSYKIFELNGWDRSKVYNTLAHEMTHTFLVQEYNETGHTQNFQNIMTRITGVRKNHRCHDYDVIRSNQNIDIVCSKCGHIGTRTRMPKKGVSYKHTGCGGVITFKRNDDFSADDSSNNGFWKI